MTEKIIWKSPILRDQAEISKAPCVQIAGTAHSGKSVTGFGVVHEIAGLLKSKRLFVFADSPNFRRLNHSYKLAENCLEKRIILESLNAFSSALSQLEPTDILYCDRAAITQEEVSALIRVCSNIGCGLVVVRNIETPSSCGGRELFTLYRQDMIDYYRNENTDVTLLLFRDMADPAPRVNRIILRQQHDLREIPIVDNRRVVMLRIIPKRYRT